MIQAALLGGVFIGILSALPIVNVANCCCLWILTGGVLAARLAQEADPRPMSVARGAWAGLLAGIIGAIVWLILTIALSVLIAPVQDRMVAAMIRNARDMPPDVREWFNRLGDRATSPLRLVLGFFFQLSASVVFSTLGGVLGAMFFRRDSSTLPGTVIPPPLPPE